MKKILSLILLLIGFGFSLSAQVTTTPAFVQKGYKGEIIVTFNPAEGNKGMVGATQCYAHTGLITSKSSHEGDWKYATPTWRGGEEKYKMTKVGNNWQLTIPNIYTYYGCPESEEILQMAFVFNDGKGGSKEGKTAEGTDIFIDLAEAGLSAKIESPAEDLLIAAGEAVSFACASSADATLTLTMNGTQVADASGTALSYTHTFSEGGDYTFVFTATTATETKTDTRMVAVMNPSLTKPRPIQDMGIHFSDDQQSVTLVTYAASKTAPAKAVYVVGDFNDWTVSSNYQMYQDGNYFWLTIDNLKPGEKYAFQYWVVRADGQIKKLSDLYSTALLHPDDKHEPAKVNPNILDYPAKGDGYVTVIEPGKTAYNWSDATLNFKRPNKNNLIIYEMWVYDWTPDRSLPAVQIRLDYLENLGVNAIELMPITEFDGNYNWGYSPNHYFAPDKAYGSAEQVKAFIDECHKRGIAVILDMVFNHATGQNPMDKLYPYGDDLKENPWFNVNAPHGDKFYEDWNHDFPEAKKMFARALQYWLTEYKVDGFRMDLSHGFCGTDCNTMVNNVKHYYNAVQEASNGAYFILEHWGQGTQDLINTGMLCWTGKGLTDKYAQTAMGYLKGVNSSDDDAFHEANRDGYVSYAESHDEERNFYKALAWGVPAIKNDITTRLNRVPANVAFNVLLNGSHMLWQWQEMGYDYSINSTKGKPNTHEDDSHRTAIKEQPEKMGWLQDELRMKQYQKVAQCIQLRTKLAPQVFEGNPTATTIGAGAKIRTISWGSGVDAIHVVGNFSSSETLSATLPSGTWYDYYAQKQATGTTVSLLPGELAIFTAKQYTLPVVPTSYSFPIYDGIFTPSVDEAGLRVYPTMTADVVFVPNGSNVQVYNLSGQCVVAVQNASEVSLAAQPQGIYVMRVQHQNRIATVKVVRQ